MSVLIEEGVPPTALRQRVEERGVGVRPSASDLNEAVQTFLAHRNRLFQVAYSVVGDKGSAEDVVQEAWVRWQRTDRAKVTNPAAFLSTTATHLAINAIQCARHRRETPADIGAVDVVDPSLDVASVVEQSAAVVEALELMMRRLSPAELCAYLLRKAFDLPYDEIGCLLRTSAPNVRQLVHRAQLALARGQLRGVDPAALGRLVETFLAATRTGDLLGLKHLLSVPGWATGAPFAMDPTDAPQRVRPDPSSGELNLSNSLAA